MSSLVAVAGWCNARVSARSPGYDRVLSDANVELLTRLHPAA
jgi:hypothetical protein